MGNRSDLGRTQDHRAKIKADTIETYLVVLWEGWVAHLFAFTASSRVMG